MSPLKKGISANIREMRKSGHPMKQAVAAAMRTAKMPKSHKRMEQKAHKKAMERGDY